jgi:uncharacterized protein YijF (DUF1287 family)
MMKIISTQKYNSLIARIQSAELAKVMYMRFLQQQIHRDTTAITEKYNLLMENNRLRRELAISQRRVLDLSAEIAKQDKDKATEAALS